MSDDHLEQSLLTDNHDQRAQEINKSGLCIGTGIPCGTFIADIIIIVFWLACCEHNEPQSL